MWPPVPAIHHFRPFSQRYVRGAVPILGIVGEDPIALGLVAGFNRPGRNATGVTVLGYSAATKRWELLHELVSGGAPAPIAILAKPDGLGSQFELRALQETSSPQSFLVRSTSVTGI